MECSNFGCAVLGNKVYVVGGALVDDRGCSVGEFPETVHPFGFAFDPISEVGLLVKVLKMILHCTCKLSNIWIPFWHPFHNFHHVS